MPPAATHFINLGEPHCGARSRLIGLTVWEHEITCERCLRALAQARRCQARYEAAALMRAYRAHLRRCARAPTHPRE